MISGEAVELVSNKNKGEYMERMNEIEISYKLDNITEPDCLYKKYPGQTEAQTIVIDLDLESGVLTIDHNPEIGNAVPMRVWEGTIERWSVSPYVDAVHLAQYLQGVVMRSLLQRLLDGCVEPNGLGRDQWDELRSAISDNLAEEATYHCIDIDTE